MHIHVHLPVPTPPLVAPLPEFNDIEFSTPTSAKRKRHSFAGPSNTAGISNIARPAMPLDANDADDDLPAPPSKRQKNQAKRKAKNQARKLAKKLAKSQVEETYAMNFRTDAAGRMHLRK